MKTDAPWYDDVSVLWKRPLEFFPAKDQSASERLNSLIRLAVYTSIALYAWSRRPKYLLFGASCVVLLSFVHKARHRREGFPSVLVGAPVLSAAPIDAAESCSRPTPSNPFANPLPGDPPGRPPACPFDEIKAQSQEYFAR